MTDRAGQYSRRHLRDQRPFDGRRSGCLRPGRCPLEARTTARTLDLQFILTVAKPCYEFSRQFVVCVAPTNPLQRPAPPILLRGRSAPATAPPGPCPTVSPSQSPTTLPPRHSLVSVRPRAAGCTSSPIAACLLRSVVVDQVHVYGLVHSKRNTTRQLPETLTLHSPRLSPNDTLWPAVRFDAPTAMPGAYLQTAAYTGNSAPSPPCCHRSLWRETGTTRQEIIWRAIPMYLLAYLHTHHRGLASSLSPGTACSRISCPTIGARRRCRRRGAPGRRRGCAARYGGRRGHGRAARAGSPSAGSLPAVR